MSQDVSHALIWSIWARIRATNCFWAVLQPNNGAMSTGYLCATLLTRYADPKVETWWAWRDCLFTTQRNCPLLLQSFKSSLWTTFRIERSPAQVTMLHTRIFPLSTVCLWCECASLNEIWELADLSTVPGNHLHRWLALGIHSFSIQLTHDAIFLEMELAVGCTGVFAIPAPKGLAKP